MEMGKIVQNVERGCLAPPEERGSSRRLAWFNCNC